MGLHGPAPGGAQFSILLLGPFSSMSTIIEQFYKFYTYVLGSVGYMLLLPHNK